MPRSVEPLWWALFSAGGMLSALFFPALIVITGVLLPLGLIGEGALGFQRLHPLVSHPLVRVALFGIIALPFFHWAHRFLYTLVELGLRRFRFPLAVLCYTTAVAGTIATAVVLWRL